MSESCELNCPFCLERERGFLEVRDERIDRTTLFETEHFYVFPALGPLVEGHLLIATKEHVMRMGSVGLEQHDELEKLVDETSQILEQCYTKPILFEHGSGSWNRKGGCCIEHAHIHLVPVTIDIYEELQSYFEGRRIASMHELETIDGAYLYYRNLGNESFVFPLQDIIPSQYIRRIVANKIGHPDRWDWRYLGLDAMRSAIEKLIVDKMN